jgi:tRNA nucleotidyltransferase (CCA-adding enzyme)
MKTYLVGGAVRDKLLRLKIKERDWVVVGETPESLLKKNFQPVGKDFPVFLHPETKEEYALARTERKTAPGYAGFVFNADPAVSLEEDLLRRDLTINAIAEDDHGNLIDPYHGKQDLEKKLLRHVSPAFVEDPVRLLRVARFAAKLPDFSVAKETLELLKEMVSNGEVDALVAERVWQECFKALKEVAPWRFFEVLESCGALEKIFPGFTFTSETKQALEKTTLTSECEAIRFAILFAKQSNLELSLQHFKAPKDFIQLAKQLFLQLSFLETASLDNAENILSLFESTDAFRRTERFQQLLQAAQAYLALKGLSLNQEKLLALLAACKKVSAKEFAEKFKGKAIAEALRAKRLKLLKEIIEK